MKHAKFYIMLVFISFCACSQNRPGIDYFPHTGFFDFTVQYLYPPNSLATGTQIKNSMIGSINYYYPYLKKLGITNLVTDWREYKTINQNSNPATDFFINDMGFSWRDMGYLYFGPANYLTAFGHYEGFYSLQFGGTQVTNLADGNNFGFGAGTNAESYWCMTDETKPPGDMDVIGENAEDGSLHVRVAKTDKDYEGLLLWGGLPWTQFYYGDMDYYIDIRLKKVIASGNPLLFKIVVQLQEENVQPLPNGFHKRPPILPSETDAPLSNIYLEQNIYWNDITHSAGVYDWFRSNAFSIAEGENLQFYIYWYDQSDLYVDQVAIYNEKYRDAFIAGTLDFETEVEKPLQDAYLNSTTAIDSRFQDFYFDEPFMLTARSRGKLQNAIPSIFGSSTGINLNGATGSVPEYFLHFDHKYAREAENSPYKNYVLFNMYPFGETCIYEQWKVQEKLNDLVRCSSFDSSHGGYSYSYAGLLPAQIAAQQYDEEPGNDLPLFMTLQVHAEHQLDDNGDYVQNLDKGKRPPTKDEIFAMGNLSLAYGVKGFMYYMIPTRSEERSDGNWGTYGLFDQNEPPRFPKYNYITKAGTWQNPALEQDTNERYTAVREFIASTSLVDSVLLKLRWLDAKGWNRTETSTINWINSVSTALDSNFTQADATPMVETGYFEEYHTTGYNPNAKYLYVVNKRCNSNINGESSRYVAMEVNFEVFAGRNNLKFTDLKTGRTYYRAAGGDVVVFLKPGDGTLFKIEPTIVVGGELVGNETVASNTTIKGNVVINSPSILTIDSGADVTIENSSKINVNNTYLYVIGSATNPCVLNFSTASWSGGNGIIANNARIMIDKAVIKNAKYGIKSYNAQNFVVENTQIETCYYGILMENQTAKYAQLSNILLSQCYARGLSANDSWITMSNFNISGCETGLWFDNCFVNEKYDTVAANLFLQDNFIGLYASLSDLYLGQDGNDPIGAYNTFLNIDQNIEAENDAYVRVQDNYWANTSSKMINAWGGALVFDEPSFTYVPDNPLSGGHEDWELSASKGMSNGEGSTIREKLETARGLIRNKKFGQARKICADILEQNGDDPLTPMALLVLKQTFSPEDIPLLSEYLLTGNKSPKGSLAKGLLTIASFDLLGSSPGIYDSIISEYSGRFPEEYSLYKKSLYQFGNLEDIKGAKITRNILSSKYPSSIYLKDLNTRFADSVTFHIVNMSALGLPKGIPESFVGLVYEYNLYNNYPNPFNPETVIKFSLKEKSSVTLTVYNITGQKVAELTTGEMEKGMYEKRFIGISHSSGVYIFRLEAQSLETKTTYSKTVKALLLK